MPRIFSKEETVESKGSEDGLSQATGTTEVKSGTLKLLQEQVKHEFFAERVYLAMAVWLDAKGFPETARFFSHHAQEEKGHAMKFVNFILQRGEEVEMPGTEAPPTEFKDEGVIFKTALDHEKFITEKITKIFTTALEEGDIMAMEIAREFIKEQVEEEQRFLSLYNLYLLDDKISIDMEAVMRNYADGQHQIGKL